MVLMTIQRKTINEKIGFSLLGLALESFICVVSHGAGDSRPSKSHDGLRPPMHRKGCGGGYAPVPPQENFGQPPYYDSYDAEDAEKQANIGMQL